MGICVVCSSVVDAKEDEGSGWAVEAIHRAREWQAYELATAQHKLELLQAQVTNTAARKRRTVQIDPNTKFANIEDIQKAQIEAGEKEDITDESSDSDTPSEAESCIVVASRPSQ
ncbi:hypothetical protein CH063_08102 [Colletotrichum higginsianum]|uniref:Uncharacterized protein n=1 Tax=Colletotrichum higginsianum (strain IMI 349063) TaxID=759273 RepID=H1V8K2_COLHI|nr:hypothetical protein CH063_08102 [Colletotrichum higginsianum]